MNPSLVKKTCAERLAEVGIVPTEIRVRGGEAVAFISQADAERIIGSGWGTGRYSPIGLFVVDEGPYTIPDTDVTLPAYSALDNSSGDCWVEAFHSLEVALIWTAGGYESVEEAHRSDLRRVENLIKKMDKGSSATSYWLRTEKAQWRWRE